MHDFEDIVEFYLGLIQNLKRGSITLDSPLDMTILRMSWDNLAYVDNRRDARKYGYDFWKGINTPSISKGQLYSESQEFPDFVYKTRNQNGQPVCGSLLETKDTLGGTISSFNSTIPTGTKSLKEINAINNSEIVSRMTRIKDGEIAKLPSYYTYQRGCFYLIRTHRGTPKAKTSLIDGSFFETVPKDKLISQMFLNILEQHRTQDKLKVSKAELDEIKPILSQINDQAIIAGSQSIDKASIKPRLRIMAEVSHEGKPHSQHYPEISEQTVNFILPQKLLTEDLTTHLANHMAGLKQLTIQHKRNGKYVVFQFKMV